MTTCPHAFDGGCAYQGGECDGFFCAVELATSSPSLPAPSTQEARDAATPDFEAERERFEAKFPRPSECQWIKQSAVFYATGYNAWDAHKHIARWEGWKARLQSKQGESSAPASLVMNEQGKDGGKEESRD